jgi:hypothetical protein
LIPIKRNPAAAPFDNSPNSKACLYMNKDEVVLENNGPPFVMTRIRSKKFTDHTVMRIRFMMINGFSSGSVIYKKPLNFVAPSIRAASYSTG